MSYTVKVIPRKRENSIQENSSKQEDNEVKNMYKSYDELPLFLTVEDLAKTLQIGLNTAYNLVRSDKISCYRAGVQYRIPKESIRELLSTVPNLSVK